MRKTITFFKRSIFAVALMIFSVNAWSQIPSNGGFENGNTGWTFTTGGKTTHSISTTLSELRTGTKGWKVSFSGAETGAKDHSNSDVISVPAGAYAHVLGWIGTDNVTYANAKIWIKTGNPTAPAFGVFGAVTNGIFVRQTADILNSTAVAADYKTAVRTKTATGSPAINIYFDDVIMYTDANTTSDVTKPVEPTVLVAGTGTSTSTTFTWTNGSETPTTGTTLPAQTGIQNTVILKSTNLSATDPVLNDQAIYSVAGGIAGPNMVGADWKVISTSVAAGDQTYTDSDPTLVSGTTYKYAVVHRDMAYNYSIALVGTSATASGAAPTKLVITSITPTPTVAGTFDITVQSQTASGSPSNVTSATDISLSKATGTGSFGGTLTTNIANGANSVTFIGITFDTAGEGISITATASNGMTLDAATSNTFTVLATKPSASSAFVITKEGITANISWTNGTGASRIVVARLNATAAIAPTVGTAYTSNSSNFTDIANGTTGTGNYVVYNGTGNSVAVTDLTPKTAYAFDVYDYNGTIATLNYSVVASSGLVITYSAEPTVQATAIVISAVKSNQMTVNWTLGDGDASIVIVKAASTVDGLPVDGSAYSATNTFGSGTQIGNGNYCVFKSTTNSVNVTGLTPNTTYYVSVFACNGNTSNLNYLLTNPATSSQTTLATYTCTVSYNTDGTVGAYTNGEVITKDAGSVVAYTITPNSGYKITSVLYNGVEVKSDMVVDLYTAPALTANANLAVQFDLATGLNKTTNNFTVIGKQNSIAINGLKSGDKLAVLNASGSHIWNLKVSNSNFTIPVKSGIYMVLVNNTAFKVIVK